MLGAHFSYFTMEEGENPLWMGEFLGQWEVIKSDMSFFFPKWKYMNKLSFYVEVGVWFAPSDVDISLDSNAIPWIPRIGFGLRCSL